MDWCLSKDLHCNLVKLDLEILHQAFNVPSSFEKQALEY